MVDCILALDVFNSIESEDMSVFLSQQSLHEGGRVVLVSIIVPLSGSWSKVVTTKWQCIYDKALIIGMMLAHLSFEIDRRLDNVRFHDNECLWMPVRKSSLSSR